MKPDKKIKIYMAGGIQYAPDKGEVWRKELQQWAKDNKLLVQFVSPLDTKANKKNDDLFIYTDADKWAINMDKIRDGDFDLIDSCDAIVTLYDEYAGDGTNREIEETRRIKHVNYFIQGRSRKKFPHWVLNNLILGQQEKVVVWLWSLEEFKDLVLLQYGDKESEIK